MRLKSTSLFLAWALALQTASAQTAAPAAATPPPSAQAKAPDKPQKSEAKPPTLVQNSAANKKEEPVKVQVSVATDGKAEIQTKNADAPKSALEKEILELNQKKEKLTAELALAQTSLEKELSESRLNTQRLQAQLAELKAQAELREFQKKLEDDRKLAALRDQATEITLESAIAKAQSEIAMVKLKQLENEYREKTAELTLQMELDQKQSEVRTYALQQPVYLKTPLQDKKLVISDRRISLNGLITMKTADAITQRINYYNNRDRENPIFIVIDESPGGSVMAGYKILKAMKGSSAPVYVVVKSFAASMAACITTLADQSYAFPNAVLMHHQISSFSGGNLTQQQEWVKEMEEWWKRLAEPVAQKMGITREEFVKRMYARNSAGDWSEFGDKAHELKWVDHLVEEIEETSLLRLEEPKAAPPSQAPSIIPHPTRTSGELEEQIDAKGNPYKMLPRLSPMDVYWLYNPDGYYRTR